MTIFILLRLTLLLTLLSAPLSIFADPPRASHDYWRNTNYVGHYVLYDAASKTYLETINCRVAFRFTAVSNELNTLTLFDASRNMTVRLNYQGMYLKPSGAADFSFYQAGTFDTRTQFENYNPNGSLASTISKRHGCVWQEQFVGAHTPAFSFVEKSTNNDAVELFDASRNLWARLNANAIYLKSGTAPYSFFHNGRWH